jgi:hypothetical protein
MKTKQRDSKLEPIKEFYIVAARDTACGDLGELRDCNSWYDNGDTALAEAAGAASLEDGDGHPRVVYRVMRYVEIK